MMHRSIPNNSGHYEHQFHTGNLPRLLVLKQYV